MFIVIFGRKIVLSKMSCHSDVLSPSIYTDSYEISWSFSASHISACTTRVVSIVKAQSPSSWWILAASSHANDSMTLNPTCDCFSNCRSGSCSDSDMMADGGDDVAGFGILAAAVVAADIATLYVSCPREMNARVYLAIFHVHARSYASDTWQRPLDSAAVAAVDDSLAAARVASFSRAERVFVRDRDLFEASSWDSFAVDAAFVVVAMNDSSRVWRLTRLVNWVSVALEYPAVVDWWSRSISMSAIVGQIAAAAAVADDVSTDQSWRRAVVWRFPALLRDVSLECLKFRRSRPSFVMKQSWRLEKWSDSLVRQLQHCS